MRLSFWGGLLFRLLSPSEHNFALPKTLLTGVALCLAFGLQAQSVLSGNFQNEPLPAVFQTLEKTGWLSISYDPALVQNIRITAVFSNKTPADAFDILLRETPLIADIVRSGYVIIRRRGETTPPPPEPLILCGRVLDADTREPLPYVSVFAEKSRLQVQSAEDGRFTIKTTVEKGEMDTVTLRYLGYQSLRLPARKLRRTTCPELLLRPDTRALMEIIVTDRALDPVGLPAEGEAQSKIRPDRGGFVPGLGEPDPFRMIQFLPGITAEGDKAGELIVRGGSSDQNLVLWEGIPIYHTDHLFGVVSALNPYVVNRVNVWKGNFGADQGGRVSSLIDMRSEPRALEKPTFSVGLNLVSAYFSFETPLFRRKAGVLVAARWAFSDLIENKAYQKLFGYATQNSRIRDDQNTQQSDTLLLHAIRIQPTSAFSDANFKFFWQPTSRTRFEYSAYVGSDLLQYRLDANIPNWGFYYAGGDTVKVGNAGICMRLKRQWTENYHSEWQIAASYYRSLYNYAGSFDTASFPQLIQYQENAINEGVFRFDNAWRVSPRQEFRFGFQSVRTANFFLERLSNLPQQDEREWSVDRPSNQTAVYAIWRLGDSTHWSIEGGLRNVTFNYAVRSYWEPRFSAQWSPLPGFRLKANAGVFHQFMRKAFIPNELGLNNEAWFTASDDKSILPVLENRQMSFGAALSKGGWLLDMEMYGKYLNPLTALNLRFNGQPESANARGEERAGGLEILLRKRWGVYTSWLSYTTGGTEARFDSLNAGVAFPTDYNQRHALSWAQNWSWKHWSISLAWNFHSGRPFTPPVGIRTELQPDGTESRFVDYGPRNTARLPDYHRMDLSAEYKFKAGKMKSTIGLSIFNFYNQPNLQSRAFFVETTYDSNGEPRYGVSSIERTLLGRMVNLFFLARW